jgi:hypothetical protein
MLYRWPPPLLLGMPGAGIGCPPSHWPGLQARLDSYNRNRMGLSVNVAVLELET